MKINQHYLNYNIPENKFPDNCISHCWQLRSNDMGDAMRTDNDTEKSPIAELLSPSLGEIP